MKIEEKKVRLSDFWVPGAEIRNRSLRVDGVKTGPFLLQTTNFLLKKKIQKNGQIGPPDYGLHLLQFPSLSSSLLSSPSSSLFFSCFCSSVSPPLLIDVL